MLGADSVKAALHFCGYGARALVEDGVARLVVQQPRDRQPLLLAERELVLPVTSHATSLLDRRHGHETAVGRGGFAGATDAAGRSVAGCSLVVCTHQLISSVRAPSRCRGRCVSIFLKNRRYIGKSQSKRPHKRTQRPPHRHQVLEADLAQDVQQPLFRELLRAGHVRVGPDDSSRTSGMTYRQYLRQALLTSGPGAFR
eukprot:COSAG01_NODE_4316_length_5136_cov_2.864087_3_plen_199_part_00